MLLFGDVKNIYTQFTLNSKSRSVLIGAENAVLHKYVVAKGSILTDFWDFGYSEAMLRQNFESVYCLNWIFIGLYL